MSRFFKSLSLKNWLKTIGIFLVIVSSIVAPSILFTQSSIAKVDKIAFKLNDYNKHDYYKGYKPSTISLKAREKTDESHSEVYKKLEMNIVGSKYVSGYRMCVDNETEAFDLNIKLIAQKAFSIYEDNADEGYSIDYNLSRVYFSYDTLSREEMLKNRFETDSFVFISDSFADKLLEKYDIDSYEELLLNEDYAILEVIDNKNNSFTFSINNIVYSSKLSGPHINEKYGDFALVYLSNYWKFNELLEVSYEIDLKADPYGNSKILDLLYNEGYGAEQYEYKFLIYDYENKCYKDNLISNEELLNAYDKSFDLVYLLVGYLIFFITCLCLIVFYDKLLKPNEQILLAILYIIGFIVYGIICNFTYSLWLINIIPLLYLFVIIVLFCSFIFKWLKRICNDGGSL